MPARHLLWLMCALTATAAGCGAPATAEFIRSVDWSESGEWMKVDTHIHTKFSDGEHRVPEIAAKAVEYGCDAIAITDHSDSNLEAATSEYFETIEAARRQFPRLNIIAGVEWNVPPDGGDTHAVVLVPPGPEEDPILREFKVRFDDLTVNEAATREPGIHTEQRFLDGLRFLERPASQSARPLVLFEHVGRKAENTNGSLRLLELADDVTDVVIGFSGASGHLAENGSGNYRGAVKLIDRWDPAVATVGGAWDRLLAAGDDLWGASAPSDFHNLKWDYWPGQFSETWVRVPEKSADGLLRGLRAGTYFGVHGHIARRVDLSLTVPGLSRPAHTGEIIAAADGQPVSIRLQLDAPQQDFQGRPLGALTVELIEVTPDGAELVESAQPSAQGVVEFSPRKVPARGVVYRARGRHPGHEGIDYLFYTNPIRIDALSGSFWQASDFAAMAAPLRRHWRVSTGAILLVLAAVGIVGHLVATGNRNSKPTIRVSTRVETRAVHVPRVVETTRQSTRSIDYETSPRFSRWLFLTVCVALIGLAWYASLIPFHYRETTFEAAWKQLLASAGPTMQLRRSDVAVNALITIPMAFCALATIGTPRSMGVSAGVLLSGLTILGCAMLSVALELSQCWFPPRVPAFSDCAAQTFGSIIGVLTWWLAAGSITHFAEDIFRQRSLSDRRDWALQCYLALFFAWRWLPLDIVFSPPELLARLRSGSLEIIPFTFPFASRSQQISSLSSELLLALPIGLWAALAWRRDSSQTRDWSWAFVVGGLTVTIAEAGQIFVASRVASITSWMFGLLGVGIGAALPFVFTRRRATGDLLPDRKPWYLSPAVWVLASLAWSALLALVFWTPFNVVRDDIALSARFRGLTSMPLTVLHRGSDVSLIFGLLRSILWCLPWGGLLALIPVTRTGRDHHRGLWAFLIVLWICFWSLAIEVGQCILKDHTGDLAEVIARAVGGLCGFGIVWIWSANTLPVGRLGSLPPERVWSNRE